MDMADPAAELALLRSAVRRISKVADGLLRPALVRDLTDEERAAVDRACIEPLRLVDLVDLGTACPSQWEAYEADTMRPIYIRYRHGHLTVERYHHVRGATGDWEVAAGATTVYSEQVGDPLDGVMDTSTMLAHTGILAS